ncbi:hypothetical protein KFL_000170070 [Klebsormidium nitens]|uniref:DHHA1 domain-containing protein n=1 Tax=Klebsormidium nitens TaxID=105231 RepID=A0A1Y1HNV1_KLENI|nr:hypothetical protein KFL_000170070 [Klebsormidium nitens]|eukprot:GAQ78661.1 hypothetical protein KFL_000170070 [Klebsormidium nitens]
MAAQSGEDEETLPGPTWVLYHYPCPDGVFAALAAYLYHRAINKEVRFVPNTVFSPRRVGDLPCTSRDGVYLLDFAGPQGFAERLAGKAGRVTVLDHHKTALETLPRPGSGPLNLRTLLDMNRSGATVAWDFFSEKYRQQSKLVEEQSASRLRFAGDNLGQRKQTERDSMQAATCSASAELLDGREGDQGNATDPESNAKATGCAAEALARDQRGAFGLPEGKATALRRLFEYIEDADLWKWTLPDSKAFSSGLKDLDVEYDAGKNPGVFEQLLELKLDDVIRRGEASLAEKDAIIAAALEETFVVELGGGQYGTCLAVKVDSNVARLRSELGNQLAAKSEFAGHRAIGAIAYEEPGLEDPTLVKVSLRSKGDEDTTVISQVYSGGGHKNASSFIVQRTLFDSWRH